MPDDPDRPGPDDLVTPFLFVPHGSPDPVEWKRQHPGWVSFPATFVPHPKPIPKWKIINGQRWPLDKRGRSWPKTRYGRPTCPFDELPPGFPAPGTQYELMRKLENPTLFWEGEPMPTVAEVLAIGERSRAERAAAAPPPPIEPQRAYDGDGFGPARDYLNAMRIVDQQLREFAASARQEKAARQERVDEQDTAPPERIDYDLLSRIPLGVTRAIDSEDHRFVASEGHGAEGPTARKRTVRNENTDKIPAIPGEKGQTHSVSGMEWLFIACNHSMQLILNAACQFGAAYCTQQTWGLTRGMTLRAIQAPKPVLSHLGSAESVGRGSPHPAP